MDLTLRARVLGPVLIPATAIGLGAAFFPDTLLQVSSFAFSGAVLLVLLSRVIRPWRGDHWLWMPVKAGLMLRLPVFLAHIAIGFLIYAGEVDFTGYYNEAVFFGRALLEWRAEFFNFPELSSPQFGTQVVNRLGTVGYLLFGSSLPGLFLLSAMVGFLGSYFFLRAYLVHFPAARERRFLAVTLFLFPSLVFWTSLLGKDSWVFLFLGLATYCAAELLRRARPRHLVGLTTSSALLTLIRPPIGAILVATASTAILLSLPSQFFRRRSPAGFLRPAGYILATVALVLIAFMSSTVVLKYAQLAVSLPEDASLVEGLIDLAVYKHLVLSTDLNRVGSSLAPQVRGTSVSEVLLYLPYGIFTYLFRPLVFEAHNVLALIAGLEGTLLLALVMWRWRHLAAAARAAFHRPFVACCLAVCVLFAASLAFESNFGVIVRHRTMVLPFLFILLSVPRGGRAVGAGDSSGMSGGVNVS